MRVLMTAPNLDDTKQVGGIITVVNTIISVAKVDIDVFVRSPAPGEKGAFGKMKWLSKIFTFYKLCRSGRYTLIHVHTAMNTSALVRDFTWVFLGKLSGVKILLHLHGGKYLFQKAPTAISKVIHSMFVKSSAIVVLSEKEKEAVLRLYGVAAPVNVLENAIDISHLAEKQTRKKGMPEKFLRLIFIGRITESKGIDDIIKGVISFNDSTTNFTFDLYGEGELSGVMQQALSPALKERFRYHGIISGNAKWDALEQADVFLLPSRYGEGLPMALLEAMALGKIVITTDDASIGLVVKNGVNGFIVNKYSPEDISKMLTVVQNFTVEEHNAMSEAAKTTIKNSYSADKYIMKLESIYENT